VEPVGGSARRIQPQMATILPSRPTLRLFSRLKRRSLARKNARDFNKEEDIVDLQWGGRAVVKTKYIYYTRLAFNPDDRILFI
jgi:hypothetical protein